MTCCFTALRRNGSLSEELMPMLSTTPQLNCRQSRPSNLLNQRRKSKRILSYLLRFIFWSSGYNKRFTTASQLYSIYLFIVCWYQVLYEVYKIAGCPEFNCTEAYDIHTTRELEYVSYLSSSLGSAASYTFMLLCLNIIYKQYSNAITPYSGLKDMSNSKAKVIFTMVVLSASIYICYLLLFVYIVTTTMTYEGWRLGVYLISIFCEFIAQWVAMVSMYAFSCSAFAVGAFAADTLRRIQNLKEGTIDDVIRIHKELRAIVKETTDAYSGWFLLHWLIYGITVIIGFVVVALHKFGHDQLEQKIYFGVFFSLNVFLFVFPCVCAAYVTSTCGSISQKINNTTSDEWAEDHIFKDRPKLQMFVSYCTASPICFKIGRITFTSTLAWFSFFFGGTGLLFHFF